MVSSWSYFPGIIEYQTYYSWIRKQRRPLQSSFREICGLSESITHLSRQLSTLVLAWNYDILVVSSDCNCPTTWTDLVEFCIFLSRRLPRNNTNRNTLLGKYKWDNTFFNIFVEFWPNTIFLYSCWYNRCGGYRNSWTPDACVGRWTLDNGRYTLDSGLWTLNTVVDCFRIESETSFWFCLIKLLKILWVRISKDLMVTLVL